MATKVRLEKWSSGRWEGSPGWLRAKDGALMEQAAGRGPLGAPLV